jgi:hypothetical protein
MAKLGLIVLVVAAVGGGTYFFLNYEIQPQQENGKPAGWKIVPKKAAAGSPIDQSNESLRPNIRIATYNLGQFDDAKLANPRVSDVLVHLLPRFDLVAVQGIRGKNRGVLVRLVEQINNATGRTFDFITSPAQQRDGVEHYSAFLFDRARIEVDPLTVGFVEDPLDRFHVKPLIGWFRAKGPSPAEAFTFWLINVENDPDPKQTAVELDLLADAYRAVANKQPQEDDVILLGDLESDDQHLGRLGKMLGVSALLSGVPTTTRGTKPLDNILLDRRATVEFTGRVEAVDMIREFELTVPGAMEVSEHLPVWAEFSVYEVGQTEHAPVGK